jgi:hypothetical protein
LPDVVAMWLHGNAVTRSRLWRVAVAVMLVLLTAAIGARHLGGRAGISAAAVLASSLGLVLAARVDGTQLLATLLGWVAAAAFGDAWFGRSAGRGGRLLIGYVALASVFVIAGPLPALWPFAAAAIYLALTRRPHGWRDLHVVPGVAIVLGIALPWYGAMIERHGAAFLRHAPLFPYALEPRLSFVLGPFLALSFVVVGMFPWSALLPGAFQHAATWWRRVRPNALGTGADPTNVVRELDEELAAHWFVACAGGALVPLLFYPFPPLSAVLPVLPAAGAAVRRLLDHLIEDQQRVGALVFRAALMLVMTGSLAAFLLWLVSGRVSQGAHEVRLLATVTFVTSWLPFLASMMGRHRLAALCMVLPVGVGAPVAGARVLPAIDGYLGTHEAAMTANRVMPPAGAARRVRTAAALAAARAEAQPRRRVMARSRARGRTRRGWPRVRRVPSGPRARRRRAIGTIDARAPSAARPHTEYRARAHRRLTGRAHPPLVPQGPAARRQHGAVPCGARCAGRRRAVLRQRARHPRPRRHGGDARTVRARRAGGPRGGDRPHRLASGASITAQATDTVLRAARGAGADAVYWNDEYEPALMARDAAVEQALGAAGHRRAAVPRSAARGARRGAYEGGRRLYRVRAVRARVRGAARPRAVAAVSRFAPHELPAPRLASLERLGFATDAGALAGRRDRGRAAHGGVLRRAPARLCAAPRRAGGGWHIAAVGGSEIRHAVAAGAARGRAAARGERPALRDDAEKFVTELRWRDFYAHVLAAFPHCEHGAFRREYDAMRWIGEAPRTSTRGARDARASRSSMPRCAARRDRLHAQPCAHDRRVVPDEGLAARLAARRAALHDAARRRRPRQQQRRLAVGGSDRHRRAAVLPRVQSVAPGRAPRCGWRLRAPLGARARARAGEVDPPTWEAPPLLLAEAGVVLG